MNSQNQRTDALKAQFQTCFERVGASPSKRALAGPRNGSPQDLLRISPKSPDDSSSVRSRKQQRNDPLSPRSSEICTSVRLEGSNTESDKTFSKPSSLTECGENVGSNEVDDRAVEGSVQSADAGGANVEENIPDSGSPTGTMCEDDETSTEYHHQQSEQLKRTLPRIPITGKIYSELYFFPNRLTLTRREFLLIKE